MDTNMDLLWIFLFLIMIANTILGILSLMNQSFILKDPRKAVMIKDPEIDKCKIASMQLFAGMNTLMELMEDGKKWNQNKTKYIIKEMEKEKERILSGQKTN